MSIQRIRRTKAPRIGTTARQKSELNGKEPQNESGQAKSQCGPATACLNTRAKGVTDSAGHDLENPT